MRFISQASATVACAFALATPAIAVTVHVGSAGPYPFTLNGLTSQGGCPNSTLAPEADQCFGVVDGNNRGSSAPGAAATASFITTTWGVSTATQFNSGDNPGDANGGLAGFQVNLGSVLSGDFVVALKQSNGFSLYFFDDQSPTQFLTFTDNDGFGGNGNLGISHYDVYGGQLVPGIPEPETYALMLAGLSAIGFVARRRRRS